MNFVRFHRKINIRNWEPNCTRSQISLFFFFFLYYYLTAALPSPSMWNSTPEATNLKVFYTHFMTRINKGKLFSKKWEVYLRHWFEKTFCSKNQQNLIQPLWSSYFRWPKWYTTRPTTSFSRLVCVPNQRCQLAENDKSLIRLRKTCA